MFSCKKEATKSLKVPEPSAGIFTNVGPQLTATTLQESAFAQDVSGKEYAYSVISGKPGHLVGYNMESGKIEVDLELGDADGSIAMVFTDNWLYIAANNAHLYRTRPGTNTLEDLGLVLPGQSTIMDLVAGKDGEVYGGTYPGARVFRYHPQSGFSDVGGGAVVAGESYVRSLAYQESTNKLYCGIGSHAALVVIDLATKAKKNILPSTYNRQEFVYYMGLAEGYATGDRLFAWVTSPEKRVTLIYNLNTETVEETLGTTDAHSLIKAPNSNLAYYTAENKLYSKDLNTPAQPATAITDCYEAKDMRWGKDGTLHILTKYSQVRRYNPATGQIVTVKYEVPPQPYDIQTLITGPDGRIWSSGYLAGGNAAYDPVADKVVQYAGLGQAEGMTVQGDNIYFGIYPAANFYVYDTKRPWNVSQGNPRNLGKIEGQDRPFAGASVADKGKLFFGTVPGYGKLGGALVEYTVSSGKLESYTGVVENQSVVSLLNYKGIIIGGTSISGGLGVSPSAPEAKLFAWSVDGKAKLYEITPVTKAWAITSLMLGPDEKIWGMADGTLFVFNPETKEVERTKKYYDLTGTPSHIWRNAFMLMHPNGNIYATFNSKFYKINANTLEASVLKEGVGLLAMDKQGRLYMRAAQNLWRYKP
ncbi:hypothetical protein BCY91_11075 [Pelobium manganitolerans]|uniref:Uncharacterized protein n=1 Tax=Pelobium manganitolerans TaxID=1842495 RepID=A0A419S2E7_9SPHI|nr:hypothetical protein BCY91_11075 [Pelobium manganitolerans]